MTANTLSTEVVRFVSGVAPKVKAFAAKDKGGKDIYVYDAQLIPIIAEYLGVRYEILTPPDGVFGSRLPDGNWTGMIGMVQREEADVAMSVAVAVERLRAVNYSYPYFFSTLTFMTDAPEPLPKNLAIFYPFSYTLWMALAGITVAMSFVFYFLLNRRQTYQRVLISTIRSTLENAIDFKMTKLAVKMAAFAWILGMFVITNGYKATLLSFLSFPTMIGIRNIAELSRAAATGSFKCITFPGTYVMQDFANSNDSSWKAIGDCLIRDEMTGDPLENFLEAPRGKAFVGSKLATVPFERRYLVSKDDFFIELYGAPFSKTFCCPEDLNRFFHRIIASGILEKFCREENFFMIQKIPSLAPEYSEASTVISLGDMSGAFYILMLGWIAGFITLLTEIFLKSHSN